MKEIKNKSVLVLLVICIFSVVVNAQNCYINLSQSVLEFSVSGGSAQIDITQASAPGSCSGATYTVYDIPSWLTVTVTGGTIYIHTNSSIPTGDYRTASIPVRANGITVNGFTVKQGTPPPPPPPDPCTVTGFSGLETFNPSGGQTTYPLTFSACSPSSGTFTFTTNGSQSLPSWIVMSQTGTSITVTCQPNTGPTRSTVIVAQATIGGQLVSMGIQVYQQSCHINWYLDTDKDGFGDPNNVVANCNYPSTGLVYVTNNLDCDDSNPLINPNVIWYRDADGDGYGEYNGNTLSQCTQPIGYVLNNDDWCPGVVGSDYGCPNQKLTFDENYIYTLVPQIPLTNLSNRSNNDNFIESISYYDDLGRLKQSISKQAGGARQDIIKPIMYDSYGKQTKEYLPYANPTPTTPSLAVRNNNTLLNSLNTYYINNFSEDIDALTPNPHSEKEIERSSLNRILKQAAPGADWKIGSGHEIEFDYKTNAVDEVRLFTVTLTGSTPSLNNAGFYNPGVLYKTITKDENHTGSAKNHTAEEFKDKQGRVVLKRTYTDTDINNNGIIGTGETQVPHDTYYVYDRFGNLTYVIPPKVDASNVTTNMLNDLCYQYKYDDQNRLVEKKIPGKGWEEIVYNKLNQPILTRDSNLKNLNKALFTKYDAFGRIAYTGKMTISGSSITRANLQTAANGVSNQFETKSGSATSYSNNAYPNTYDEVHTINYYDNYNFDLAGLTLPTGAIYGQTIAVGNKLRGLATGSKVRVLDTSSWITTITMYDGKGRAIYVASKNDYLNTTDITQMEYDFGGKVLKTRTRHKKGSDIEIVTLVIFEYDHAGRLLNQVQCIGNDSLPDNCNGGVTQTDAVYNTSITSSQNYKATKSISLKPGFHVVASSSITFTAKIETGGELIFNNHYDELGQLYRKNVGGKSSGNGLQTVDYVYNIRGWLKRINNPANLGNDLFGFEIKYNNIEDANKKLFNGNISQTIWNSKSINTSGNVKENQYTYSYDALNRIMAAIGGNTTNYNLDRVNYDKNGNIVHLKRYGHKDVSATTFGLMDDLAYTYHGNQLKAVNDDVLSSPTTGFIDGAELNEEYWYDSNGNMTIDANKGITEITYNHLNLPVEVKFGSTNKIKYFYDATGVKLSKEVTDGSPNNKFTYYAGNYIYEGSSLKFISHPEGYAERDGSGSYDYVYQYKDHLGNIRLSYKNIGTPSSPNLEILEENNYYPFGLRHKGYNNVVTSTNPAQNYTFNGKEEQEELGLDWIDYGFRNYDPAIGRWHNMDAHSELYFQVSPYNYAMNSPINFVDYMGLDPIYRNGKYYETNDDGEEYEVDFNYVYNWIQNNDGIAATYTFELNEDGNTRLIDTEKGDAGLSFNWEGKTYTANSYMTLMGRDDRRNNVGDFKDIQTLDENQILAILGQASFVIHELYKGSVEQAMLGESLGGRLDYKTAAYDILGLNRRSLVEIKGVVYNPNEAGNFLWGMVLEHYGGLVSPNLVAELGTRGRPDERWEQKAITAGRAYGVSLYNNMTNQMIEAVLRYRTDAAYEYHLSQKN